MTISASLLAIVATHAEFLVNQQDVGRFAQAIVDEELRRLRVHIDCTAEAVFLALDEIVDLASSGHIGQRAFAQRGLALHQPGESLAGQAHDFGLDRGFYCGGSL